MPNRDLSQALRGDYQALCNDVHQANALAEDFQRNAAGKSNEIAVLKHVFEKAQEDLARLHASLAELRQERHHLANEAMRVMALERKLAEVTAERDRYRAEGGAMRKGLITSGEEAARRKRETDAQIARMALELEAFRQRCASPAPSPVSGGDAEIRAALAQISANLERLTDQLAGSPRPAIPPRAGRRLEDSTGETIEIAFES